MTQCSPRGLEWVIAFLAGPEWENAVLGDLRERRAASEDGRFSYCLSLFQSIPGLCLLCFSNLDRRRFSREIGLFVMFGLAFWTWELQAAQKLSWPIAQRMMDLSPYSTAVTCKAVYVCLYSLGASISMSILLRLTLLTQTHWRLYAARMIALPATLTSPALVYLLRPGVHDGDPGFRFVQLTILALMLAPMRPFIRRHLIAS